MNINPDVEQVCATEKQEKLPRRYIIEGCQYLPKDLKVCWGLLKITLFTQIVYVFLQVVYIYNEKGGEFIKIAIVE